MGALSSACLGYPVGQLCSILRVGGCLQRHGVDRCLQGPRRSSFRCQEHGTCGCGAAKSSCRMSCNCPAASDAVPPMMPQGYSSGAASLSSSERWGVLCKQFGARSLAGPAGPFPLSSTMTQARGMSRLPKPVYYTPSSVVSCPTFAVCCPGTVWCRSPATGPAVQRHALLL